MTADGALRLTSNEFHQARSVWAKEAVPVEQFRTDFTFNIDQNTDGADGFTFTILNGHDIVISGSAATLSLQAGTVNTIAIVPNPSGGFQLTILPRC